MISFTVFHKEDMMFYYSLMCLYHFRCISLPSAISPIKAHRVSRIMLTNHRVTAKFLSVRVKLRQRQMSAWMKIKLLPALRCFLFLKTQNFNSFHWFIMCRRCLTDHSKARYKVCSRTTFLSK